MKKTIKKTKPAKLGLTDRSRVEQSLRNSELRYRCVFETAQDGILILDAKTGAITDVNPYLIELLGYSREEFIEKKLWQVGAFKDIEASKDAFEALQENEYIRYENLPLKAKDGRLIQVEFVSNVYRVGDDKVIQCNIRDITEHKRLVAAMQENERKYRTLVAQSPDGLFLVDLSGNFSAVNKAMCDELGFTEEEFRSMNIWDIVPDQYLDQYRKRLTKILNGESLIEPSEYAVRGKDGKILNIEVISAPYYSEKGVIGFQGIARDITARKRAEEALRESEQRFRALTENASDLIVILNPDYTIAYVSPSVERILGYTVAAVTGAKIADFVEPQDLPNFIAATGHRIQTPGTSPFLMQARVRHADGSWRTLEGIGSNLLDQPGVSGLVINARDITERKRVEEALRESEEIFSQFMQHSPIYVFFKDEAIRAIRLSSNYEKMLGKPVSELLGKTMDDLFPSDLAKTMIADDLRILKEGKPFDIEEELDGRSYSTIKFPIYHEGEARYLAGFTIDITERKRAEEESRRAKASAEEANRELQQAFVREQHLARTDALTGVNNRRYWFELAEHEFEVATRYRHPLSVILFDIDHFKLVNDTFGHVVGDQVLERVAQVARAALRSADVIGRYGGEEFVVVLPMTTASQTYRSRNASAPASPQFAWKPPEGKPPSRSASASLKSRSRHPRNVPAGMIRSSASSIARTKRCMRQKPPGATGPRLFPHRRNIPVGARSGLTAVIAFMIARAIS